MPEKIKIAVISGGLSNEREVSLKSGEQVFSNLDDEKYEKYLIEITKDGKWLATRNNLQIEDKSKNKSLVIMDSEKGITENDLNVYSVVFLALHGTFGEDGRMQSVLDILGVPYTGSGVLASALGMDKLKSSQFVRALGIKTPNFLNFYDKNNIDNIDKQIESKIGYPCVVKPTESGSSIGISIVKERKDLNEAIKKAYDEHDKIIIEEFIEGREITCGVLGNNFDKKLEALPPVEIISKNEFFDYNAKYFSEDTEEICPTEISNNLTSQIQDYAKKIHRALGCDGLTRSDFILRDGEFYFLEVNTLPGLTEQSLCPKEARAAGMSFSEFIDRQVNLAIEKSKRK
ncbi:MAG: D-alanine--D-alanine ligase [Patescibacteria group bacterium]|nr:D-alanine--D-alanine ligase [Patescibacteria group bacterium]